MYLQIYITGIVRGGQSTPANFLDILAYLYFFMKSK